MVSMTVVSGTLIKGVVPPLTPLSVCVDFFLVTGLGFFLGGCLISFSKGK